MSPDEPVTRREVDQLLAAARTGDDQREELGNARWSAHDREHNALQRAVDTADTSSTAALQAALNDHHREHNVHEGAHDREHRATEQALGKAEAATEKRFASVNEFREQLREQAARLASKEALEAHLVESARRIDELRKDHERRMDEMRLAITNIEKGDVKVEGKEIGRSTMVALIVTAIGLVGTVLGIVIVIANFATRAA